MTIFNKSKNENKELAAKYVFSFLSETSGSEIVKGVETGCGKRMTFGVQNCILGLVHVTCTSVENPSSNIRGWKPNDLERCTEIDHLAFVWADKEDRVLVFILERLSAVKLAKQGNGSYSKNDIRTKAIKSKAYLPGTTL